MDTATNSDDSSMTPPPMLERENYVDYSAEGSIDGENQENGVEDDQMSINGHEHEDDNMEGEDGGETTADEDDERSSPESTLIFEESEPVRAPPITHYADEDEETDPMKKGHWAIGALAPPDPPGRKPWWMNVESSPDMSKRFYDPNVFEKRSRQPHLDITQEDIRKIDPHNYKEFFQCGKCEDVVLKNIFLSCEHVFCHTCLTGEERRCPKCKVVIHEAAHNPVWERLAKFFKQDQIRVKKIDPNEPKEFENPFKNVTFPKRGRGWKTALERKLAEDGNDDSEDEPEKMDHAFNTWDGQNSSRPYYGGKWDYENRCPAEPFELPEGTDVAENGYIRKMGRRVKIECASPDHAGPSGVHEYSHREPRRSMRKKQDVNACHSSVVKMMRFSSFGCPVVLRNRHTKHLIPDSNGTVRIFHLLMPIDSKVGHLEQIIKVFFDDNRAKGANNFVVARLLPISWSRRLKDVSIVKNRYVISNEREVVRMKGRFETKVYCLRRKEKYLAPDMTLTEYRENRKIDSRAVLEFAYDLFQDPDDADPTHPGFTKSKTKYDHPAPAR